MTVSGKYEERRARFRTRAQNEPFYFPPGLAHMIATVREPRSDGAPDNPAFDKSLRRHRDQLMADVADVLRAANDAVPVSDLGGAIEDVIDQAAARLRATALEHNALDVVDRLDRLVAERRLGMANVDVVDPGHGVAIQFDEIPRSRVSRRRVGLWR